MNPLRHYMTTMCERYDQALKFGRDSHLPAGTPYPKYTCDWPGENVALLERYREWLASGGHSETVIRTIFIPMAGHVLGLFLKPFTQLNLATDLQPGLDFVLAKGAGPDWRKVCRNSLEKFRRFLPFTRGQVESKITPYDPNPHTTGLPDWLVNELIRYQHIKQRNWREARLEENIRRFWSGHLRTWRFLVEQKGVRELADLKRVMVYDYADLRLQEGHSAKGVNSDLRSLHAFLGFLQDQGYPVPHALLRLPCLKEPDALPRFLTDEQVRKLRDDFEGRVRQAQTTWTRRDALLDRAAFYLLWQSALRISELEELRLEDLDLTGKRLVVRRGKGLRDRSVFLTETTVRAVQDYLAVRGQGPTGHVFLYRNQPLCKDLVRDRIKAAGIRVSVHVYPHRLRHTCATQLLNAGCRITSIQKLLGHQRINSTLIYARVHDQTVADDYYLAMGSVEKRLELVGQPEVPAETVSPRERRELLALAEKLAEPEIAAEARLALAAMMVQVLSGRPKRPLEMDDAVGRSELSPPEL